MAVFHEDSISRASSPLSALVLFWEGNFMGVLFKAEYPTVTGSQYVDQP